MKNKLFLIVYTCFMATFSNAQPAINAGSWKTWFISSGKDYRLPAPPSYQNEIPQVLSLQKNLNETQLQQVIYWNAGAPNYHWQEMMNKLWMYDPGYNGALANLLLGTAIYDAMIAAWDTRNAYRRPRPFAVDKRIRTFVPKAETPSYPCEHSVAAGVAATIISHFYPAVADSVQHMAEQVMESRVAAGMAFPADTRAGFELGKKIAEMEIEHTKNFVTKDAWDGKLPEEPGRWKGPNPMLPLAGRNKTVVLDSSSQLRPAAPPDFAKDMAELRSFKPTFRSNSNAFYWASQDFWSEALARKIFEYNIQLNPPAAARIYAITAVATYDCFAACFDAKYAYWGTRPDQYDTTYHPLVPTPPFPGYPSGHAMMSGMYSELYSYFFPADSSYFRKKAKDAAESRFQAGIHFRTDNEVGLELGKKVAEAVIRKVKTDGADADLNLARNPGKDR